MKKTCRDALRRCSRSARLWCYTRFRLVDNNQGEDKNMSSYVLGALVIFVVFITLTVIMSSSIAGGAVRNIERK